MSGNNGGRWRGMLPLAAAIAALGATLACTGFASADNSAADITPPTQPASGPGGAGYQWSGFVKQAHTFTDQTKDYWTFEPSGWTGAGAKPAKAPLVVFVHGWTADKPAFYQDWITHLVRKGTDVIFPRYQTSAATPPDTFTANAIWSIKDGLTNLKNVAVKPDTAKGMEIVSHSWGGPVAANIANRWSANSLPKPKAVFFAEPYFRTIDDSLAGIPSTTKLDCLVGDDDTRVGRTGCDAIWDRTGHISAKNRNYLWMYGDDHGSPALVADHRAPASTANGTVVDALDYYGFWKIGDALRDCGLGGTNCAYALGDTAKQTNMGEWSDGTAVKPLTVTTTKPDCPAGSGAKGC